MLTSLLRAVAKPIQKAFPLSGTRFTPWQLRTLDESYRKMNEHHRRVHDYMIRRIAGGGARSVLEVACGTGWNVSRFRDAGLSYFGLDISETAIALASLKYPENQYVNTSIADCSMFRDGAFDVVYNSAMLEHIGYFEEAIQEMVRLARRQTIILFFEGLSENEEHQTQFHRWDERELSGQKTNIFGCKLLFQNHRLHEEKGWYWNRYSRAKIEEFLHENGYHFEFLTRSNCSVIEEQTVLIISKNHFAEHES